jgi:hypothetical protein
VPLLEPGHGRPCEGRALGARWRPLARLCGPGTG